MDLDEDRDRVRDVPMAEAVLEPPRLPVPRQGGNLQPEQKGPLLWMMMIVLCQLSRTFSRLVLLAVGALYPAYLSCKAVHARSPRDYVCWMMYWVVFAAFLSVEPLADLLFGCCLPLYAELKIAFVFWLQSSTTHGASLVFRKFLLPEFTKRESEIDSLLDQLHARASQVGASTARYVTQVLMQTVFSHIRDNYSIADLVSSELKLNLFEPVGEGSSSLEDPSEMALGDQGGRRRLHKRADDDAKRRKISTNTL